MPDVLSGSGGSSGAEDHPSHVTRLQVSRSALELYSDADPESATRAALALSRGEPLRSGLGRIGDRDSMDLSHPYGASATQAAADLDAALSEILVQDSNDGGSGGGGGGAGGRGGGTEDGAAASNGGHGDSAPHHHYYRKQQPATAENENAPLETRQQSQQHHGQTYSGASVASTASVAPAPGTGGFGDLVACRRDCPVCRRAGRLRYVGHRSEVLVFDPDRPLSPLQGQQPLQSGADGRPIEVAVRDGKAPPAAPTTQVAAASPAIDVLLSQEFEETPVPQPHHGARPSVLFRARRRLSEAVGMGPVPERVAQPHVWQNVVLMPESTEVSDDIAADGEIRTATASGADTGAVPVRLTVDTDTANAAAASVRRPVVTENPFAAAATRPTADYTARGFVKVRESGAYVTIGVVSSGPDAAMTHSSDGYADLVIARRGGLGATLGLLARYVGKVCGVSDERNSPLFDYVKARSVVLTPNPPKIASIGCSPRSAARRAEEEARSITLNVDGETLPGPGPFKIYLLPSLLTAYGEY